MFDGPPAPVPNLEEIRQKLVAFQKLAESLEADLVSNLLKSIIN